jgi:hypothetical protein
MLHCFGPILPICFIHSLEILTSLYWFCISEPIWFKSVWLWGEYAMFWTSRTEIRIVSECLIIYVLLCFGYFALYIPTSTYRGCWTTVYNDNVYLSSYMDWIIKLPLPPPSQGQTFACLQVLSEPHETTKHASTLLTYERFNIREDSLFNIYEL